MIEIAKLAARESGKILLDYFSKKIDYKQKPDKTFVSDIDKLSEKKIKRIIMKKYPDHSINGEEYGKTGSNEFVWHIDPLDGTNNYRNGIPYSCVSIGIQRNQEFIIGVIYNPFTDELFYAETGKGAFLNGKRIYVKKEELSTGIALIDASYREDRAIRKLNTHRKLLDQITNFRMIGSNALQLTEIARGNCIISISDAIHAYDFAAGIVLVKEAGGFVSDQFGNDPTPESKVIIASNNKINHCMLINITKETYRGYKGM